MMCCAKQCPSHIGECPLLCGLCCKSRFAEGVNYSEDCWRDVGVMIRRTSSPHAKFMGEFGNATGAIRIAAIFALRVFAKIYGLCNFRLLQHNRLTNGHRSLAILGLSLMLWTAPTLRHRSAI